MQPARTSVSSVTLFAVLERVLNRELLGGLVERVRPSVRDEYDCGLLIGAVRAPPYFPGLLDAHDLRPSEALPPPPRLRPAGWLGEVGACWRERAVWRPAQRHAREIAVFDRRDDDFGGDDSFCDVDYG